jgi:dienelactone hydrolase
VTRSIWFVLVLLGAGCATQPPTPVPISVARDVVLQRPGRERPLELRIAWPERRGRHPVVVLSHGGGSSKDMYDRIADHWAAAGYVVVLPTHLDSRDYGFSMADTTAEKMLGIIEGRRRDLSFILDSLPQLEREVTGLAGRVDAEQLAVAGHSLGGATALTLSGLEIVDPKTRDRYGYYDGRFDVLILITEPGNSPVMPDRPWRAARIPVLVMTGSKDYSGQWQGPPKVRLYDFAEGIALRDDVPHHYLFIEDMDHYVGGLICRTDKGPADPEALRLINEASTAFLDAYLKGDARGRTLLAPGPLAARGQLTLR